MSTNAPDGGLFPLNALDGDRHAKMLETAVEVARSGGWLSDIDEAALSLARANATALDQAEADRKYYAVAQLSGPYLEILNSLKLTPDSRDEGGDTDAVAAALADLSAPSVRNT
ncbi:TPA: hypothetical protein ACGIZG_001590 [Corynebacterium striatum]|nr:hypothetical protein [Corynebacterium striatum]HAT6563673.1 hypothetical protein [Corynebacterium striatum]HAT6569025.1 hypothetical protein [Corynebacterium striatum]HAT6625296.1 hypothetical protein [Corynebacterium striatum]HCG2976158.1 hypothetical protein [Corynebacterium striatum]